MFVLESENIDYLDLGHFWEDHRGLLQVLAKIEFPYESRFVYKEVTRGYDEDDDLHYLEYSLINFYANRKRFLRIDVEYDSSYNMVKEEIVSGDNIYAVRRTILNDNEITNKAHKDWLKTLFNKRYSL